ncbi:MAG: double-strand break repair protein AddB [Pikeienuella sp.]
MFADGEPRIFALPPGVDFSAEVARGIAERVPTKAPEAIARVQVVVNTQRTARAIGEAFEALADSTVGHAGFTPRISTVSTLGTFDVGLPPSIDRLTRRLTLTRLVEARLRAAPDLAPPGAAGALAGTLATLLDDFARNEAPLERLADAVEPGDERLAQHWRKSLEFLNILKDGWPGFLDAVGRSDIEARRAAETEAQIAAWRVSPPEMPVIGAGSTGSTLVTRRLLIAIAGLPQGALILPGFDFSLDADGWAGMGPDHPQFGFKALLADLGVGPDAVALWRQHPKTTPRTHLLSEALRPAPVTDQWRAHLPALSKEAPIATDGMTLIEAPGPRQEADAIALLMRGNLESDPDAITALVTPDRTLARRVVAALARWGVEPDDSAGRPLSLTPPGLLLRVLAECLARPFDARTALAALKHPLTAPGDARADHRRDVEALETNGLRNRDERLALTEFDAVLKAQVGKPGEEQPLLSEALAARMTHLRPWPVAEQALSDMVAAHRAVASALTDGKVWAEADGRAAEALLARFEDAAETYGTAMPADYPALFATALAEAGDVRAEAFRAHARLRILGPLEARAQAADVMILSGLNEGIWPQAPAVDPWLNRPMRAAIGLPPPERRTGLSAHDFQQAAAAPRVVFTRSLKVDGSPTTPSRWLQRLTTLIEGAAPDHLARMRADGAGWLALAEEMSGPLDPPDPTLARATQPMPRPGADARRASLNRISVTQVKTLTRDPYAIYARKFLRLNQLDEPGAPVDVRDRGQTLHSFMERFVEKTRHKEWPGQVEAGQIYDRLADDTVAEIEAPPATTAAWRARLARVRPWFLRAEDKRRAEGTPIGVEVKGKTELANGITLSGVADRIDRQHDGRLAIYDYKAGTAPSAKQEKVFDHQLLLLAEMAEVDAFEGIVSGPAEVLAYLSLSGTDEGGKEVKIPREEAELAHLSEMLDRFLAVETPFTARVAPEKTTWAGPYDHLSRFGEWGDAEGEDDA